MSQRRALVVHTRMPAFDRDSGSQDIDNTLQFLLRAGWHVTFLAREEKGVAEERHAQRLRQMGIATHTGFDAATRLLRSGGFDLALIAFWEPATELVPLIRKLSPDTRIVVNSMDVHFLRIARQSFGQGAKLGASFGGDATKELNVYSAADAVIAVSAKEHDAAHRLPWRGPRLHRPSRRADRALAASARSAAGFLLRRELPPSAEPRSRRVPVRGSPPAARSRAARTPPGQCDRQLARSGKGRHRSRHARTPARRLGAVGAALHRTGASRRGPAPARCRREAQGHPVADGRHSGGDHAGRRRGPRSRPG